ncbi:MAG: PAS domain S-box protein [Chloroflexota bacterium]
MPLDSIRTLIDRSPDLLFRYRLVDPAGFVFVSAAAERITGYPAAAYLADPLLYVRLLEPDDPAAAEILRRGVGDWGDDPQRVEVRIIHADGSARWIEGDLAVERDAAGVLVAIDGVVRDVTERMEWERRVAAESRILSAIRDAVIVTDRTGLVTFWNRGAETLFGVPAGDAIGRPALDQPLVRHILEQPSMLAAARDGAYWTGDVLDDRPAGPRILDIVSYPLVDGEAGEARVVISWDVSAEREAAIAWARLAAVVEQADEAIFTVDRECRVQSWNRGAEHLTGIAAADAIGQHGPIDLSDDERDHLRTQTFDEGRTVTIAAVQLATPHGASIPASVSVTPVREADGRIRVLSIIARDERPRLEADRELRFRDAILRAVDDAVIATTEHGTIVFWSPGAERVFGVEAADALGQPLVQVAPYRAIHGDRADLVRRLVRGIPVHEEVVFQRHDGARWIGDLRAGRITGPDGSSLRLGVIRDVTATRQAAEERARLAAIVDGATDIIFSSDANAVIRSWNPGAGRALGYRPTEIVGRTIAVIVEPEALPAALALHARVLRGGEPSVVAELTLVSKDGTRVPVSVTLSPVRDDPGGVIGLAAIAQDLRGRRVLEEQLRQAQKLEAIGRLVSGIAHDFNNMLTAVTGYGSLLLTELPEHATAAADVHQILQAADRAADLTRSLLSLSSGQPREPQVVEVDAAVSALEPSLKGMLPAGVVLRLDAASGLKVLVDQTELELVIVNLVANAGEAMPGGGRVDVLVRRVQIDAAFAETHLGVAPGPHMELLVRDTGPGLSEEARARLFEPFYTTKPMGEGAGLGLATAHAYVERAGGTIWVESKPGHGATFRILLPPARGAAHEAAVALRDRLPIGGSERILLVEDDTQVRTLATTILSRAGYVLTVKGDARRAQEVDPLTVDLLVTDVLMPHLSGPGLAADLRDRRPDLPVLFMSGFSDRAESSDLTALSSQPLLAKPFGPVELLAAVRKALDEGPTG